jgi:hypothetical protein
VSHEHILTKDAEGEVWVVVLERDEIRLYPFIARTSRNGDEERQQFATFVTKLPQDHAFHRYAYEGEEERRFILQTSPSTLWHKVGPKNS